MKKIFYEKVGKRYRPVYEYDAELMNSMPEGAHLLCVYPGGQSIRYRIDISHAPMIAAGRVAEEAICAKIAEATKLRIPVQAKQPLTEGQVNAWKNLQKEMGLDNYPLEWPSYHDAAEAGVKAMQEEAEKLMNNPAVKKAYEHFLLVAELTKEENNERS